MPGIFARCPNNTAAKSATRDLAGLERCRSITSMGRRSGRFIFGAQHLIALLPTPQDFQPPTHSARGISPIPPPPAHPFLAQPLQRKETGRTQEPKPC
jgi:hypothetical protein